MRVARDGPARLPRAAPAPAVGLARETPRPPRTIPAARTRWPKAPTAASKAGCLVKYERRTRDAAAPVQRPPFGPLRNLPLSLACVPQRAACEARPPAAATRPARGLRRARDPRRAGLPADHRRGACQTESGYLRTRAGECFAPDGATRSAAPGVIAVAGDAEVAEQRRRAAWFSSNSKASVEVFGVSLPDLAAEAPPTVLATARGACSTTETPLTASVLTAARDGERGYRAAAGRPARFPACRWWSAERRGS
jgi:hypothetical protein